MLRSLRAEDLPMNLTRGQKLTFFHAEFGKEFPSRTFWRDPSRSCPSPSSALRSTFRMAKTCREKGRKRGGQQRGQKGKKDARKQVRKRHMNIWHIDNFWVTPVTDPPGRVFAPWVPHTAHKHLTLGHPVGRPLPLTQAVTGQNCSSSSAFFFQN